MKLLTLQYLPASCYFLPPSSKYLPQYPVIKYCKFSGYVRDLRFMPGQNDTQNFSCSALIFMLCLLNILDILLFHMEIYSNLVKKLLL